MSDDLPKPIRDVIENCVLEAETLLENVVRVAASQERAEPETFKEALILKCLWEFLGSHLIEHHDWTTPEMIGVLIGEDS